MQVDRPRKAMDSATRFDGELRQARFGRRKTLTKERSSLSPPIGRNRLSVAWVA